jgi:hypothetical protein
VEVVKAGVSGYGTASQLLYFLQEGRRYEPDLVMLAFYPANDIKNNSPTLEKTLRPVYAGDGSLERVVAKMPRRRQSRSSELLRSSMAYRYIRRMVLTQHPVLAQNLVRYGLLSKRSLQVVPVHDGIPVDLGVYARSLTPAWQQAWVFTEGLLTQLQRAVEDNGARLMVVVLPSSYQIYQERWEEIIAAYPRMRGKSWDMDLREERLLAWCVKHDVPCVALASPFRAVAAESGIPLYFRHDRHLTVTGHRLAASVVESVLEQREILPVERESLKAVSTEPAEEFTW